MRWAFLWLKKLSGLCALLTDQDVIPQIHLPSVDTGLTFDGAWLVRIGRVNSGNLDASLIDMVAGQVSQNIMAVFLAVDISTHGRINSMRGLAGPS